MVWEGVPWFMAEPAEHSAEIARVLAYAAVGQAEGVVGPGDCKVTASAIPDGNIHIQPGAVGVLNRFAGGGSQAYLVRNVGDEVKALDPQGSGGPRYDLVAIIVEDPQYPGQPDPADFETGPYVRTAIYKDVGANVRTLAEVDADQSGFALARVAFNASDGTVTTAEITDLRQMLITRSKSEKRVALNGPTDELTQGAFAIQPAGATWSVEVPAWANRVVLEARWAGIQATDTGAGNGNAVGAAQVKLGILESGVTPFREDATGANKPTTLGTIAADVLDCTALAGTVQNLQALLCTTAVAGMTVQTTAYTCCVVEATFLQVPV